MIVHTILYVENQKRSCEFYKNLLGLEPILDVPGMTEFQLSPQHVLGLMPNAGIAKLLGEKIVNPQLAKGIPKVELYIRVKDPTPMFAKALEIGASELSPILERDWGGKAGYVMDFDGNILAFST